MMTRTIDKLPKCILSLSIRSELIQHSSLQILLRIYVVAKTMKYIVRMVFIYWHGEEVLYPNYVEVFLTLTTTERKCLRS